MVLNTSQFLANQLEFIKADNNISVIVHQIASTWININIINEKFENREYIISRRTKIVIFINSFQRT